jgi:phosphoribosylanthranilate isomerase
MPATTDQVTRPAYRTRIKICGLTIEQDVREACAAGADALGFVFYPKSKRFVTPEQAGALARGRDVFVSSVGLFVEPDADLVASVIECMHPSYLQFHGDESAQFCSQFNWPYIKAFRVGAPGLDTPEALLASCREHLNASAWLFDSYTPAYGGSGHSFDHALLELVLQDRARPVILSGGLNEGNVTDLVMRLQPDAVDVSSGVELTPGVKSSEKITQFVRQVRLADSQIEPR